MVLELSLVTFFIKDRNNLGSYCIRVYLYLSGPMHNIPDNGKGWRQDLITKYTDFTFLDPTRHEKQDGLVAGSAVGSGNAAAAGGSLQARYDTVYAQCMSAKGNQIPPPPPYWGGY
jgi:hypothetical protein